MKRNLISRRVNTSNNKATYDAARSIYNEQSSMYGSSFNKNKGSLFESCISPTNENRGGEFEHLVMQTIDSKMLRAEKTAMRADKMSARARTVRSPKMP